MKKAYVCEYCDRSFTDMNEALIHESSHWTSYSCDDRKDSYGTVHFEPETIIVTLTKWKSDSIDMQFKKALYKYVADVPDEGDEHDEG